jgi:hypothetical protein
VRALLARTPMRRPAVVQLANCCAASEFTITEELKAFVSEGLTGIRGTQVVEDGFQRLRRGPQRWGMRRCPGRSDREARNACQLPRGCCIHGGPSGCSAGGSPRLQMSRP